MAIILITLTVCSTYEVHDKEILKFIIQIQILYCHAQEDNTQKDAFILLKQSPMYKTQSMWQDEHDNYNEIYRWSISQPFLNIVW